jgi:hypothetical protein
MCHNNCFINKKWQPFVTSNDIQNDNPIVITFIYIVGKKKCLKDGWHLTFDDNHWSTLETIQQFVNKVDHTLKVKSNMDCQKPKKIGVVNELLGIA